LVPKPKNTLLDGRFLFLVNAPTRGATWERLSVQATKPPIVSIIDDDPWAREGIKDLVVALGYRTLTFASAEAFLASGSVDATTCVITDLQMPGLSGLDLQQKLLEREHGPAMIVVTAYPDEKSRARALAAGAFGYLTKPFDEKNLIQCLASAAGYPA
jgi:FixJ family two-component response regulator